MCGSKMIPHWNYRCRNESYDLNMLEFFFEKLRKLVIVLKEYFNIDELIFSDSHH